MIEMLYTCPENLDKMGKTDCGLYCDSCKKEVFDFTGKSLGEIAKIQDEDPSISCGVFDSEVVVENPRTVVQNIFRIAFAAVFVLGLNVSMLFAQSPAEADNIIVKETVEARESFITGQVFNHNGKAIAATISYYLGDEKVEFYTEKDGTFKIEIPADYAGTKLYIDFHAKGMSMQHMTIEQLSGKCYTYEIHLQKVKRRKYRYRGARYAGYFKANYSRFDNDNKSNRVKF